MSHSHPVHCLLRPKMEDGRTMGAQPAVYQMGPAHRRTQGIRRRYLCWVGYLGCATRVWDPRMGRRMHSPLRTERPVTRRLLAISLEPARLSGSLTTTTQKQAVGFVAMGATRTALCATLSTPTCKVTDRPAERSLDLSPRHSQSWMLPTGTSE